MGLNWAARSGTRKLLSALVNAPDPVTHSLLDEITPPRAATHLRAVLVSTSALPARDERLISLERSLDHRISRIDDPDERKILRRFTTWHHLRRLCALADRRPITPTQVDYARNSLDTRLPLQRRDSRFESHQKILVRTSEQEYW